MGCLDGLPRYVEIAFQMRHGLVPFGLCGLPVLSHYGRPELLDHRIQLRPGRASLSG